MNLFSNSYKMKYLTLTFVVVVLGVILMSLGPQNTAMAGARKIRILKKLGALALLHKKKYLFAVPFPLPIPIPWVLMNDLVKEDTEVVTKHYNNNYITTDSWRRPSPSSTRKRLQSQSQFLSQSPSQSQFPSLFPFMNLITKNMEDMRDINWWTRMKEYKYLVLYKMLFIKMESSLVMEKQVKRLVQVLMIVWWNRLCLWWLLSVSHFLSMHRES